MSDGNCEIQYQQQWINGTIIQGILTLLFFLLLLREQSPRAAHLSNSTACLSSFSISMFVLGGMFSRDTNLPIPPSLRTRRRARVNLAMLAMVSAERHWRSGTVDDRRPIKDWIAPRSVRDLLIGRLWEISFRILSEAIWHLSNTHNNYFLL